MLTECSLNTSHISSDVESMTEHLPIHFSNFTNHLRNSDDLTLHLLTIVFGCQTLDQRVKEVNSCTVSYQTQGLRSPNEWLNVSQRLKLHLLYYVPPCFICQNPNWMPNEIPMTSRLQKPYELIFIQFGSLLLLAQPWEFRVLSRQNKVPYHHHHHLKIKLGRPWLTSVSKWITWLTAWRIWGGTKRCSSKTLEHTLAFPSMITCYTIHYCSDSSRILRQRAVMVRPRLLCNSLSMYLNWPFWHNKGRDNVLYGQSSTGSVPMCRGAWELSHLLD